jgi:hypothetical protein
LFKAMRAALEAHRDALRELSARAPARAGPGSEHAGLALPVQQLKEGTALHPVFDLGD